MDKSMELIKEHFESSCTRTKQYLAFHRTFKREIKKLLAPHTNRIEVSKPNHFDVSGFFELHHGTIYYFSIGDLRWCKDKMLIRTAKDFKDYKGGMNQYILLDDNFAGRLLQFIGE